MKTPLLLLLALSAALLPACTAPLRDAPPNTHAVVGPRGSSDSLKSWNRTTKQEGDAALGPLGNSERR